MLISKITKGEKYDYSISIEFNKDELNLMKLKIRRAFSVPIKNIYEGKFYDYAIHINFYKYELGVIKRNIKKVFGKELAFIKNKGTVK